MSAHHFDFSNSAKKLAQSQGVLRAALDKASTHLLERQAHLVATDWVDVVEALRVHKREVEQFSLERPACAQAVQEYLVLLSQLRHDVATRMTLQASGAEGTCLPDEFQMLAWQVLSTGAAWLKTLDQTGAQAINPRLSAGDAWLTTISHLAGQADRGELAQTDEDDSIDIDQMLYASFAKQAMTEQDLGELAQSASRLNRLDRITGVLMYADGLFVQLFEGPRDAVNDLWARLLRDQRHQGIVQLYHRREVEQRSCRGWSMKLVDRSTVQAIVHDANQEVVQGRKTAWAPAIERMDQLLKSQSRAV